CGRSTGQSTRPSSAKMVCRALFIGERETGLDTLLDICPPRCLYQESAQDCQIDRIHRVSVRVVLWCFENHRESLESRIVNQATEYVRADFPNTDSRMSVDAAAELSYAVVQME